MGGYAAPDDVAILVDEHVVPLTSFDALDLDLIQVYITHACRIIRFQAAWGRMK
jgi:hypothetical protein